MEYFAERRERLTAAFSQFLTYLRTESFCGAVPVGTLSENTFEREVLRPLEQVFVEGKRNRATLTYLSHDIVGGNSTSIDTLALVPELLHKGSVIIDDVQDSTTTRYGKPTLHRELGAPLTVNIGTLVYFLPLEILEFAAVPQEMKAEIISAYRTATVHAAIGQQVGLAWRKRRYREWELPTEAEYLNMVARKTGMQLVFAAAVGAIAGNATTDQRRALGHLALHAGVAYQLHDDLLDLDPGHTGALDDLRQGEITLPEIWLSENNPRQWQELCRVLKRIGDDPLEAERARTILTSSGGIAHTKTLAEQHLRNAQEQLARFDPSTERELLVEILERMITWR